MRYGLISTVLVAAVFSAAGAAIFTPWYATSDCYLLRGQVGHFSCAAEAWVDGDHRAAVRTWERLASFGDSDSQITLAAIYILGDGVGRNPEQAKKWARKAFDKGKAGASNILGVYHLQNEDYREAFHWFELAAKGGEPDAINNLGYMYWKGLGVASDAYRAMDLFARSAAEGYPIAMRNMGLIYGEGAAVPRDYDRARQWLRRAERAGDPTAADALVKLDEIERLDRPAL
ncbi:MAG: tetratricopeptide repeat protein [Geminicoccaceae bacterium]